MHKIIRELSSTKSLTTKALILRTHAGDVDIDVYKEVFAAALSPTITYGVAPFGDVPQLLPWMSDAFNTSWRDGDVKALLYDLSIRTLSGDMAKSAVSAYMEDDTIWPILYRILAHDLRCGMRASTINKVFKDLIPTFPISLAKVLQGNPTLPAFVEPKLDGMRCIAKLYHSNGKDIVTFQSRKGFELTGLEPIADELLDNVEVLPLPLMFDGELYKHGTGFDEISGAVRRNSSSNMEYHVFDVTGLNRNAPLTTRQFNLNAMFGVGNFDAIKQVPSTLCHTEELVNKLYAKYLARGYEGVMIKDPASLYIYKRSNAWLKLKPTETYDGVIVDMQEGTGKYQGMLGALMVDINGVVTAVGSGFSDTERTTFWNCAWIEGRHVEVKGQNISALGRIRFPRFVRLRDDLDA